MEPPRSFIGFRYMTRFRCIGSACEDTCCHGLSVPMDEAGYEALRRAMSGSEEERAEFKGALVDRRDAARRSVALLVRRPDGDCTMLGADRLCSIQRRYGEALLPASCALYPRVIGQRGDRVELSGSLSCPEVARLCLLSEDGADLVPIDQALLGRDHVHQRLGQPRSLYEAAFDDLRELALYLLSLRRYPMDSRLFFLLFFAQQSLAILRPPGTREDGVRLHGILGMLRGPEVQEKLHERLGALDSDEPFAIEVVTKLLGTLAGGPLGFRRVLGEVLDSYARETDAGVARGAGGELSIDAPALHAAYRKRRGEVAHSEGRIDEYLERFCINFWVREWYVHGPNLLRHTMCLLVRVAALRFLLRSHPALRGLRDGEGAEERSVLDDTAVAVCAALSRAVDHAAPLMRTFHESLAAQGAETLPHAVCLIRS